MRMPSRGIPCPDLHDHALPKTEGAGNAGRLARPQPRMQKWKAYEIVTTGPPQRSGTPCAMVLRVTSCSPRRPGFVVSVIGAMRQHCRQLDISVGISGPHDFIVRDRRIRLMRQSRPSHPAPDVRDDRDTPLCPGAQDAGRSARDLPDVTSENACDRLARRANQVNAQIRMSMINRHRHHAASEIADRFRTAVGSRGYNFRGFRPDGAALESQAWRAMTGTARRSSVIFLPRQRKNTGKTGVAGKK